MRFETRVDTSRPEEWRVSVSLDSREGVPTGAAVLQSEIPAETIVGKHLRSGGKELAVPEKFLAERIGRSPPTIRTATIAGNLRRPLPGGVLCSAFSRGGAAGRFFSFFFRRALAFFFSLHHNIYR